MSQKIAPPEPTQAELKILLGRSYAALDKFLAQNNKLRPEWKYYGVKLGWNLKLFDGKRNLCFIGPHEKHWAIAFLLGAKAVDAAMKSKLPDAIRQDISTARTYVEGRGVRLEIRSAKDLAAAQLLLEIKQSA